MNELIKTNVIHFRVTIFPRVWISDELTVPLQAGQKEAKDQHPLFYPSVLA